MHSPHRLIVWLIIFSTSHRGPNLPGCEAISLEHRLAGTRSEILIWPCVVVRFLAGDLHPRSCDALSGRVACSAGRHNNHLLCLFASVNYHARKAQSRLPSRVCSCRVTPSAISYHSPPKSWFVSSRNCYGNHRVVTNRTPRTTFLT